MTPCQPSSTLGHPCLGFWVNSPRKRKTHEALLERQDQGQAGLSLSSPPSQSILSNYLLSSTVRVLLLSLSVAPSFPVCPQTCRRPRSDPARPLTRHVARTRDPTFLSLRGQDACQQLVLRTWRPSPQNRSPARAGPGCVGGCPVSRTWNDAWPVEVP